MDSYAYLISQTYVRDSIGNQVAQECERGIYVTVLNISRAEFYSAGQQGLQPSIALKTSMYDYKGEKVVKFDGLRYSVYRTYTNFESEETELYLNDKAGVRHEH